MIPDSFDQPTKTCSDLLIDLYKFRLDESRIIRNALHQFAYATFLLLEKRTMGLTRGEQELADKLDHHFVIDGLFAGLVCWLSWNPVKLNRFTDPITFGDFQL